MWVQARYVLKQFISILPLFFGLPSREPYGLFYRVHCDLLTTVLTERLAKLDLHQGFVKGVCWDPVGEFLATQSDDRTVRIWRTTDWQLQETVTKPFEHSPGSTFFRRLRFVLFFSCYEETRYR